MNYKLLRSDYYNEEHKLNPQETKEFYLSIKSPYYRVRALSYVLNSEIFGKRENLQHEISLNLFHKEIQIPNIKDIHKYYNQDLFEKKFGLNENSISENLNNTIPIYLEIPEVNQMRKDISYNEIYNSLSKIADRQMLFINLLKERSENNLTNAIIYFPFTPSDIEFINDDLIQLFSKLFSLSNNKYFCSEREKNLILKQKLMDMYYLCDDNCDLHGVTDCHSFFSLCPNISSFYCENNMCKKCCEISPNKNFCPIHDDFVNYYRDKMNYLLSFEQINKSFDRSKTIRILIRKNTINKNILKKIFSSGNKIYKINWDNIDILYKTSLEKIQFVYLQCESYEEAKSIYNSRTEIIKNSKYDISIQPLMENITDIINKIDSNSLLSSCLLVVPISSIVKNYKTIPSKGERNKKFSEFIESFLNINSSQFKIYNCQNVLSNESMSYEYYIVTFQEKSLLEKFYLNQPYFEAVIVHKLNHLKFFPLLRNKSISYQNFCINCINSKNPKCYFDLCIDCCNNCNNNFIKKLIEKKIGECPCKREKSDNYIYEKYTPNKISKYTEYLKSFSNNNQNLSLFTQNYNLRKTNIKLIILNNLRNGEFSWFRPISDTDITRAMLDMNKEFTIIMDNPSYKREQPLKINDKMYKVYTYQIEQPINKSYDLFNTEEGFDEKGDYYIEYDFTQGNYEETYPKVYVEVNEDLLESINNKNINENNKNAIFGKFINFHICFYGLDNERYTNYELIEEIYHELKSQNIKVNKENIQILDEGSILAYIIINKLNTSIEKFDTFGRFVIIKMKYDKDALKIYLEKCKLLLPLLGGRKGIPLMIPGNLLKNYIES